MASSKRLPRADLFTIIAHWLLVGMVVFLLLTGLGIAYDSQASFLGPVARLFGGYLIEGRLIAWHLFSASILIAVATAYLVFLFAAGQKQRISLAHWRRQFRARTPTPAVNRWGYWNAILFRIVHMAILVAFVTGVMLYRPEWQVLPPTITTTVHSAAACIILAYWPLHVLAQLGKGSALKIFRPRRQFLTQSLGAALLGLVVAGGAVAVDRTSLQQIEVRHTALPPRLDGNDDDPAWQTADEVRVETLRGANFVDGSTTVSLRALHDGDRFFLLAQWEDPTRSQDHLPLIKTEAGWELLQTGFLNADENEYYEDKLALLFSDVPILASAFTHHGKSLIEGSHKQLDRGLHFTTDGAVLDLWHWKSLRTGQMSPGFADDNHIGPPIPSVFDNRRYTGGYQPDYGPAGYHLNFCLNSDTSCALQRTEIAREGSYRKAAGSSEARLQACLARDRDCADDLVPILIPDDLDSAWSGVVRPTQASLYDVEKDTLPLGTRLPGVIIDDRLGDDRSDVRAQGSWQSGTWTVEFSRSLGTGSDYDVTFRVNKPLYLWVAPFDHAQTRHSHHLRPIRVKLIPE